MHRQSLAEHGVMYLHFRNRVLQHNDLNKKQNPPETQDPNTPAADPDFQPPPSSDLNFHLAKHERPRLVQLGLCRLHGVLVRTVAGNHCWMCGLYGRIHGLGVVHAGSTGFFLTARIDAMQH